MKKIEAISRLFTFYLLFVALLYFILPQAAQAATYYLDAVNGLDTNPGTSEQPWKTISYALGKNSPVGPGDTVYLRGGTYREQVEIKKYGTSGNWITVKNYPGETPIIDGTDPVIGWTQAQSDDSYLTVQGVVNPHYASIYWVRVLDSVIPHTSGGIPRISSTMLFEDSTRCRIASEPNQSLGYGEKYTELRLVDSSSTGQKAYLIDSNLTQDDDYWNGALVRIAENGLINDSAERTVADYIKDDHKVVFDSSLVAAILVDAGHHDRYRLVNHPYILDSAGEFYVSGIETIADVNYRRIYFWPSNTANLTSKISLATRNYGFYQYGSAQNCYMVLDGLNISGYKVYGVIIQGSSTTNRSTNFTVQNCNVTDCNKGIYFHWVNNLRAENNYVRRCEADGIEASTVDSCVFKGNNSGNNSVGLSFYGVTNGTMINNTLYGTNRSHSDGTVVYDWCEDILVAGNIYYYVNASFTLSKNICVFSNLFLGNLLNWPDNPAGCGMTPQSGSGGDGYQVFMNNTAPVASVKAGKALTLLPGITGIPHYYVVNNILYGMSREWSGNWDSPPSDKVAIEDRTYNAYTAYHYSQTAFGWFLKQGEQDLRTTPLSSIFVNVNYPTGEDSNLMAGSPLIRSGKNVQSILTNLGIIAKFPEYDFSKDLVGNSWDSTPSIGALEFQGVTLPPAIMYGDINGDGSISVSDALLAVQHSLGLTTLTPDQTQKGDVSGAGGVTSYDAALILQRIAGIISKFPVE
jgi:hypothetical protein